MIDTSQVVEHAITLLRSELKTIIEKGGECLATEAGKSLIAWFRARLGSKPVIQQALTEATAQPSSSSALQAFRSELQLFVAEDVAFRTELQSLLESSSSQSRGGQAVHVTGDSNKIAQASGDGNTIRVS